MAISQDWWDRWWKDDWSWDGLAKKSWHGRMVMLDGTLTEPDDGIEGAPATLQDYWRDQANDLVTSPDGKLRFTRIHLPLTWPDGSSTGKAVWDDEALDIIIATKLAAAEETEFKLWGEVIGADRRAQFQGAVFGRFNLSALALQTRDQDDRIPLSIRCDKAAFAGDASFESAAFAGNASFESAAFAGNASFESAAFAGYASFQSATFSGYASFHSAAFAGYASFESAAFAGYASFQSAAFAGNAYFHSAAFAGYASFQSAAFAGYTSFQSAAFAGYTSFESAVFEGPAVFSGQGNSVMSEAVAAELVLPGADVDGEARTGQFKQAETVNWTARRSFPQVDFEDAVFMDAAKFDNRDFHSDTSFKGVVFFREAVFHNSDLHRGISFTQTDFEQALEPGKFAPGSVPNPAQVRMFEAAEQIAQAKGETAPTEEEWVAAFSETCAETKAEFEALDEPDKNSYFEGLEDAFRTLKQIMEDRRNRGQEANFFKLELQARRHRRDKAFVPFWERFLSDVYRLTSDFGTSITRPLTVLTFGVFILAGVYLLLATAPTHLPTGGEIGDAFGFSFSRVLPFGPWADDPAPCSMIGRMLAETAQPDCPLVQGTQALSYRASTPFGIRLLASLQSLVALILVFLSGLAVRRRFQIN